MESAAYTPAPEDHPFDAEALHELALLALILAHGADADLDPREIDTLADRLLALDRSLSGDDVIGVFHRAAEAYNEVSVSEAEAYVDQLADTLDEAARRRAFALLRAVAEADGVLHPMETVLLRHIADAWDITPAFLPPDGPPPSGAAEEE